VNFRDDLDVFFDEDEFATFATVGAKTIKVVGFDESAEDTLYAILYSKTDDVKHVKNGDFIFVGNQKYTVVDTVTDEYEHVTAISVNRELNA
jgi:hypothetical protein